MSGAASEPGLSFRNYEKFIVKFDLKLDGKNRTEDYLTD